MNDYLKTEILNMKLLVSTFSQRCQFAAIRDDERISAREAKTLKRIEKASNRFIKELERIG